MLVFRSNLLNAGSEAAQAGFSIKETEQILKQSPGLQAFINTNPSQIEIDGYQESLNEQKEWSFDLQYSIEAESKIIQTESAPKEQYTYLDLLKQSPAFEGVDVTYKDLEALSLEAMKPLDEMVLKSASQNNLSREEAESIIGAASPYIQASVDKIQTSAEQLVTPEFISASEQTQAENEAARATYFELLKQHPDFKDLGVTTREELLSQPVLLQQIGDRQVTEVALGKGLSREEVDRVIGQGSPYIQNDLKSGSRSTVPVYLAKLSVDYQKWLNARTATKDAQVETVSPDAADVPAVVAEAATEAGATVAPASAVSAAEREFDFPKEATNHAAPVQGFATAMQTHIESAQATAAQAKETLELAQKNLSTFAKTVKHRGFKAWASDQMPILKQKAMEFAVEQGTKVRDWAKEQAPVVKEVAIHAATKIGEQAFEKGTIAGTVAVALGRVAAEAAVHKGKELGAIGWEKFEKATQLVDPATLDPALKDAIALFGKNGRYEGQEFNFQQTKTGVDVHLKDGTPVYTDGKLNPEVDGRFTFRLSKIPENLGKVKSDIQQQFTAQQYQKKSLESPGFSR